MLFNTWMDVAHVLIVAPLAYLGLVVMLRVSGKRTLSKMNAFDFVVTVAMGSMLASIILSDSVALVEGLAGMGMLILLQFVITWLSVRHDVVARLVKAEPTLLFHRGNFLDPQMTRMRVTRTEVKAAIREHGMVSLDSVASVVLETDGTFSVIATPQDDSKPIRPAGVPTP
jgi:uncharacterized membrane protein YcaP (DUF421 family)